MYHSDLSNRLSPPISPRYVSALACHSPASAVPLRRLPSQLSGEERSWCTV